MLPPTPPPDIDVTAWDETIDELERRAPERLALVHFGVFDDVARHLGELRERLHRWEHVVDGGASEEEFIAAAKADLGELTADDRDAVQRAMPLWQTYAGLKRWVERVKPSRSPASASA